MEYQLHDDEYFAEEHEEEAHYRSFSFADEAMSSTYYEEEDPVYRSVSMAAMPTNSYYEPPTAGMAAMAFAAPKTSAAKMGLDSSMMAPPSLSRFTGPISHVAKSQKAASPAVPTVPVSTSEPKELCVLYQLEQTHLVLNQPISEILSVISTTLQNIGAVFEFKESKHKFKCHLHSRSATIPFHIRIFKQHATGYLIVEIQKRGGCSIQFCKVWRSLNDALTKGTEANPLDSLSGSSPVLPLDTPTSTDSIQSTLSPLLSMVRSTKIDLQRQALISLDMLSYTTSNAKDILADDDALDCMRAAVEELTDTESLSRSLSIITNIFSSSDQRLNEKAEQLAVASASQILQILCKDTDIRCLNLHVQGVRALACISAASQLSLEVLNSEYCKVVVERKLSQCSVLAYTDRSMDTLTQMQKTLAANLAQCA